ncbi:MAG: hypothetical protein IJQ24_12895 [Synergistaceae bacterium]|nr:hypothetical protein [Synergistaceae bacterium]
MPARDFSARVRENVNACHSYVYGNLSRSPTALDGSWYFFPCAVPRTKFIEFLEAIYGDFRRISVSIGGILGLFSAVFVPDSEPPQSISPYALGQFVRFVGNFLYCRNISLNLLHAYTPAMFIS